MYRSSLPVLSCVKCESIGCRVQIFFACVILPVLSCVKCESIGCRVQIVFCLRGPLLSVRIKGPYKYNTNTKELHYS